MGIWCIKGNDYKAVFCRNETLCKGSRSLWYECVRIMWDSKLSQTGMCYGHGNGIFDAAHILHYITLQICYLYMVVKNTVDHYCCFSLSRRYCTRRRSELPNFGLPDRDGEKKPSAAQVAKHPWWQSNASLRLRCCRFHHSPTCCHREDAARTGRSFFLSVASWNVSRGRKLALGETWLSIGVRPLFWKFTR
jgi:hypothetical protein